MKGRAWADFDFEHGDAGPLGKKDMVGPLSGPCAAAEWPPLPQFPVGMALQAETVTSFSAAISACEAPEETVASFSAAISACESDEAAGASAGWKNTRGASAKKPGCEDSKIPACGGSCSLGPTVDGASPLVSFDGISHCECSAEEQRCNALGAEILFFTPDVPGAFEVTGMPNACGNPDVPFEGRVVTATDVPAAFDSPCTSMDPVEAIAALEAVMCPEAGCNLSAGALVEIRKTLEHWRALEASLACGGDGAQGTVGVTGAPPGRRRAKGRRRG